MHRRWIALAFALTFCGMTQAYDTPKTPPAAPADTNDENLWLEDIDGAKPLDWVKKENAQTVSKYTESQDFKTLDARILEVLDSDAKIPVVSKIGDHFYNFWRDKEHPKGLWRRTTLAEYRKDKPAWETVIDLDALAASEKENWVWHGAQCLKPDYRRCLVSLSRGGADADVVREFDLSNKTFVKDGFTLPEAKTLDAWIDDDHLFVATDFGPGSMTDSSYARIVKEWKRGTPLSSAKTVYEGKKTDMSIWAFRDRTPGYERDFVSRALEFYSTETFLRGKDGKLTKIDVPSDAETDVEREWLLIEPRTAWTVGGKTYPSGSLLAANFDDFMAGKREITVLFNPDAHTSMAGHSWTRHHLILNLMHDVVSEVRILTPAAKGDWKSEVLSGAPALSTMQAVGVDADDSDAYFLTVTGYLQPTTLYYGVLGQGDREALKHSPSFFDASKFAVSQHFATSKDGTKVPYFEIAPKAMKADGRNPTLVYGYGGFEIPLQPMYSAGVGRAWLEKGGVYVVANIRGGGEYGPAWHQAALKANRPRAYEDFAAVSQDLIDRKITSPKHLGMMVGSNGGLLAGNLLTK
jgi:prolyl oligopeptidase